MSLYTSMSMGTMPAPLTQDIIDRHTPPRTWRSKKMGLELLARKLNAARLTTMVAVKTIKMSTEDLSVSAPMELDTFITNHQAHLTTHPQALQTHLWTQQPIQCLQQQTSTTQMNLPTPSTPFRHDRKTTSASSSTIQTTYRPRVCQN